MTVCPRAASVRTVATLSSQVCEEKAAPCSSTTTRPVLAVPGGGLPV